MCEEMREDDEKREAGHRRDGERKRKSADVECIVEKDKDVESDMAFNIKFTKFDNTPWGFRLTGGSDFPHPLTVIRVTEGSLAECMGLKVGDVVVRLNDQAVSGLTHAEVHEAIKRAGNNFLLAIQREPESDKTLEALQGENLVPYKSLDELRPLFPEQILHERTVFEDYEEITVQSGVPIVSQSVTNDKPSGRTDEQQQEQQQQQQQQEVVAVEEELGRKKREEQQVILPEKPIDENSEIVPNQNLTDEEIAQLILEEEELLTDQGVLGVNFKKLRPRAAVLKGSKVLEELEKVETEPPPKVEQLKRTTTFLQKPQRPVPQPRNAKQDQAEESEVEGYRVVIKKQQKRSVTDRLLEKGLLDPRVVSTPEYPSEAATPCATPEPGRSSANSREGHSRPGSRADLVEVRETIEESETVREVERIEGTSSRPHSVQEAREETKESSRCEEYIDKVADNLADKSPALEAEEGRRESIVASIEKQVASIAAQVDKEKIKELVSTEINLEKQLENVQRELLALKQLPSEIENHLRIVSEQLHMIMELSGAGSRRGSGEQGAKERVEETSEYTYDEFQEIERTDILEVEERSSTEMSGETPRIIEPSPEEQGRYEAYDEEDDEAETKELDEPISVKSADDDCRVKKFIVSYETKLLKSRDPSPATSHGSFEPDPNLSAKDQVIQELQHRTGRKRSRDLWPQAKQLELTLGRRWRCPNDFFNDDMIAEVLCSQAEVIRGRAMGVNFKKYEKTNLPNYDHLMNSSVYKMIHKMEKEPKKGIPARPAKVNAAEDIYERAKSPALSFADDRSTRSVSH